MFVEQKKKLVVDVGRGVEMDLQRDAVGATPPRRFASARRDAFAQVRDKDDLELYYKTIPDYFEQDDGRKLTEVPDRTSTDMIEGHY